MKRISFVHVSNLLARSFEISPSINLEHSHSQSRSRSFFLLSTCTFPFNTFRITCRSTFIASRGARCLMYACFFVYGNIEYCCRSGNLSTCVCRYLSSVRMSHMGAQIFQPCLTTYYAIPPYSVGHYWLSSSSAVVSIKLKTRVQSITFKSLYFLLSTARLSASSSSSA